MQERRQGVPSASSVHSAPAEGVKDLSKASAAERYLMRKREVWSMNDDRGRDVCAGCQRPRKVRSLFLWFHCSCDYVVYLVDIVFFQHLPCRLNRSRSQSVLPVTCVCAVDGPVAKTVTCTVYMFFSH